MKISTVVTALALVSGTLALPKWLAPRLNDNAPQPFKAHERREEYGHYDYGEYEPATSTTASIVSTSSISDGLVSSTTSGQCYFSILVALAHDINSRSYHVHYFGSCLYDYGSFLYRTRQLYFSTWKFDNFDPFSHHDYSSYDHYPSY